MINQPEHLSPDDLAGFLHHGVSAARRQAIIAHLDRCPECREELAAGAEIGAKLETEEPASGLWLRSHRHQLVASAALAAGLGVVLLYRQQPVPPLPIVQPVRTPSLGEGRAGIEIVWPQENASIDPHAKALTWHATAADFYRLTLLSESGEPLWTLETADTSVAVPRSVNLKPGAAYFWRADAIAAGIAASTGSHRFVVSP